MDRRHRLLRQLPVLVGVVVVALVAGGLIWFIRSTLSDTSEEPKRQVQIVQIVRPPPPPPPPPEERPPPPPEEPEERLPQDEPDVPPDDAAAPQLGLDADGTAGGDGFGLAARRGGRDLVGSGGSAFAWYTGSVRDRVLDALTDDEKIRRSPFSLVVRVWIEPDGTVARVQLANTTGNTALDAAITERLSRLGALPEAPPIEMPQPLSLRIVSRS